MDSQAGIEKIILLNTYLWGLMRMRATVMIVLS